MRFLFKSFLLLAVTVAGMETSFADTVPVPTPKPDQAKAPELQDEAVAKSEVKHVYQSACPVLLDGLVTAKTLPPISDGQCGERSPLEVTRIAGVKLSSKAVLNCRMATSLVTWVNEANIASAKLLGSKIKTINSSTTYQCRRRNNAPTGKISEHGFANALDIIGFSLEDGRRITLLEDWPLPEESDDKEGASSPEATPEFEFLKTVRDKACEKFTTVLGPESNPLHADHFHFDMGCHGKKCTYRICE